MDHSLHHLAAKLIPTTVTFKESVISPLLKKSTLDKDQLSNYRSISNLSLISKIIERVVKSRLTDHLTSNKLLNPHQSAYCKHHSTETVLLYTHDHLINAIGSQLSYLCLLDLSAALTPLTIASYFACHLGSASMALCSTGSSRTFHLAPSASDVITLFRPTPSPVASPKAPFSVLCFLSCTLPPSALSSPPFLLTITFMQTTPNCSHLTGHLRLKHHPPAKCRSSNPFLDDCQSSNSQFLQD